MSTVIVLAVCLTIALIIAAVSWYRRSETVADLGTVSHQWIAEQKFGPHGDSRR
jgi:hypothetical protein